MGAAGGTENASLLGTYSEESVDILPRPAAIKVEAVDSVIRADRADIVARLRNVNARAGIPDYQVTFVLLDDDNNEISYVNSFKVIIYF